MPNTGTLTGLSPSTGYVLDAVHVDAKGNVSAVASSAPFTTEAGSAAVTTFLARTQTLAWEGVKSFSNATHPAIPADLAGRRFAAVVTLRNTAALPSSVLIGGTAAALRLSSESWNKVAIYDAVAGTATDEIVLTLPAPEYWAVDIYETTGAYLAGVVRDESGAAPLTHDLSLATAAGQAVIGGVASNDLSGLGLAGLTQRGSTLTVGGRSLAAFDSLAVAGGAPEAFAATLTGGTTRYLNSVLALYG
jgi:hypothetical protein